MVFSAVRRFDSLFVGAPAGRWRWLIAALVASLAMSASAVAAVPIPPPPNVYFIGDSVTAGFGYCGTEGGFQSSNITCASNQPFANAWNSGDNSLSDCTPPEIPNDRCSNNNDKGMPWSAAAWTPGPSAPSVAYSYVIAREQGGTAKAPIYNWAVTGSTPLDWNPSTGLFRSHLEAIKNSYVVMTLGANPLLSYYLKVKATFFNLINGKCADSTVEGNFFTGYRAAQLNGGSHGVLRCFNDEWARLAQTQRLVSIYKKLIQQGDHILVLGYPPGCPWSFGDFQPQANLSAGPAQGNPCTSEKYPEYPDGPQISQFQQALALGDDANRKIQNAVSEAASSAPPGRTLIAYVSPDRDSWIKHEAWDPDSWFFKNDTWVHPSVEGHRALAASVIAGMCAHFGHWCGNPPVW